jgi:hypothetical protein
MDPDPAMMERNMTSMVPMMVVGGCINWHFSGFVTTKVRLMRATFGLPDPGPAFQVNPDPGF